MHIDSGQFQVSKVMDDGPLAGKEDPVEDEKTSIGRGGQAYLF